MAAPEFTSAFISVSGDCRHGFVGGSLILNQRGRPIEFHCTTPVKPNRAQEILYGPTLRPHVIGEQIAAALYNKIKSPPQWVLSSNPEAMLLREQIDVPLVVIAKQPPENGCPLDVMMDDESAWVHQDFESDLPQAREIWQKMSSWIDLCEPFERIREAIQEAMQTRVKPAA